VTILTLIKNDPTALQTLYPGQLQFFSLIILCENNKIVTSWPKSNQVGKNYPFAPRLLKCNARNLNHAGLTSHWGSYGEQFDWKTDSENTRPPLRSHDARGKIIAWTVEPPFRNGNMNSHGLLSWQNVLKSIVDQVTIIQA